jgi:hypothetical protein
MLTETANTLNMHGKDKTEPLNLIGNVFEIRHCLHEGRVTLALGLTLLFLVSQGERKEKTWPRCWDTLPSCTLVMNKLGVFIFFLAVNSKIREYIGNQ